MHGVWHCICQIVFDTQEFPCPYCYLISIDFIYYICSTHYSVSENNKTFENKQEYWLDKSMSIFVIPNGKFVIMCYTLGIE